MAITQLAVFEAVNAVNGGYESYLGTPAAPSGASAEAAAIGGRAQGARQLLAGVYGGIHFRFDQVEGGRLGREVATYVCKHNLRKTAK